MNKTLLLIIIDFLFLNLIALTHWQKVETMRPQVHPAASQIAAATGSGPSAGDRDLVDVMKLSLQDEQNTRTRLAQQLQTAQSTLQQRDAAFSQLQTQQNQLEGTLANTRQNVSELAQKYTAAAQDATVTKERLAQLQRELEAKQALAEQQSRDLSSLAGQQAEAQQRIENLNVAVKVAEQEKQLLRDSLTDARHEVATIRQENQQIQQQATQLAAGVGQLAENSGQLAKEIRENRPINANTLYSDFLANRVQTVFHAVRRTFFGPYTGDSTARTVFVSDGKQVYALVHIADTPFSLAGPGWNWQSISAKFSKPPFSGAVAKLEFLSLDPRIVAMPVDAAEVAALGVKVYQTALDPFKFPEAVLISSKGQGYGEVSFKLDPQLPQYVKMDNRLFKRIFGDFAPSTGDLVFSKTGELLGVMVNSDYCAVISNFLPAKTIATGDDIAAQNTGAIFDALAARIQQLPLKLQ